MKHARRLAAESRATSTANTDRSPVLSATLARATGSRRLAFLIDKRQQFSR
jgi:hypothetical protein